MNQGIKGASSAPDRAAVDAFKGILISLIVLGHNTLFFAACPLCFNVLYNFHVACFLLLPFIVPGAAVGRAGLRDRLARYFVPHWLFFALACLLYLLLKVPWEPAALADWAGKVALAVVISDQEHYKEACGFGLFWFLPALFAMVVLLGAYRAAGPRARGALLGGTLLAHGLLGLMPNNLMAVVPWTLDLVLFLFPLGLAVAALWHRYGGRVWFHAGCLVVFVACIYASVRTNSYGMNNGGGLLALDRPLALVFHDLYLIAAFFGLLGLAWPLRSTLLALIGRRSLFIFLAHSFVWQFFVQTGLAGLMAAGIASVWLAVAASFLLTMALTLGASLLLERHPRLYRLIFPKKGVPTLFFKGQPDGLD